MRKYVFPRYEEFWGLVKAAGKRVIVPHLRGYGTTRFASDAAPRNGQQAALAVDLEDSLPGPLLRLVGCAVTALRKLLLPLLDHFFVAVLRPFGF